MSTRLEGLLKKSRKKLLDIPAPADARDWELLPFLDQVYARQNPRIINGSPRTLYDYQVQVHVAQEFLDNQQLSADLPLRPLVLRDVTKPFAVGLVNSLLSAGRSVASCNKVVRVLVSLTRWAALE